MRKQETEQERNTQHIYTVIFGQMSLENPSVGKPVQQSRVLLLCSSNFEYNLLDAQLAILYREKLDKTSSEMVSPCH